MLKKKCIYCTHSYVQPFALELTPQNYTTYSRIYYLQTAIIYTHTYINTYKNINGIIKEEKQEFILRNTFNNNLHTISRCCTCMHKYVW